MPGVFFNATSLFYCVNHFQGCTSQPLLPIQKSTWCPHQCREVFVSSKPVMVGIKCFYTVFPMKMLYMHDMMCRQMHRPTHISKTLGRMLFCHKAKLWYLHGSWFLIFLELHLSEVGTSSSAWSSSSVESGLVNPFGPGLASLQCFDGEPGMPSSQLLVGQLTGNTSSASGTGVGSLLLSPSTAF